MEIVILDEINRYYQIKVFRKSAFLFHCLGLMWVLPAGQQFFSRVEVPMNLRDLEYFVAVIETGHFGKASERCCVSQPTLSGQLRKLEEELGQSLINRDTRQVRLTAFGQEAYPLARTSLEAAGKISRRAQELKDPFSGPFYLAGFPTLAPWLLPRIMESLYEGFNKIEFYLTEEKSLILQERLLNGQLDAVFLALPQVLKGICIEPLFIEDFYLAVPSQHPLAQIEKISSANLDQLEVLLLEDGHCLRDQALDLCQRFGSREKGYYRASSLETLRQMVRSGRAVTFIPRLALPEVPERGIKYLPLEGLSASRSIGLCYSESHPRVPFIKALARNIRELCPHTLPVQALAV